MIAPFAADFLIHGAMPRRPLALGIIVQTGWRDGGNITVIGIDFCDRPITSSDADDLSFCR